MSLDPVRPLKPVYASPRLFPIRLVCAGNWLSSLQPLEFVPHALVVRNDGNACARDREGPCKRTCLCSRRRFASPRSHHPARYERRPQISPSPLCGLPWAQRCCHPWLLPPPTATAPLRATCKRCTHLATPWCLHPAHRNMSCVPETVAHALCIL